MLTQLQSAFTSGTALKVITGLNNFNPVKVLKVAKAATLGKATFLDIAADGELVRLVRNISNLPICVSAVEPEKFINPIKAGADLIEIGNFDSFYSVGRYFGAEEVLELTKQTRALFPNITLSVTVPHILTLSEQVILAEELVKNGADIIQTEGGTSSNPTHAGTLGLIEKAAPTLAATYEISRNVSVPVLCASGISNVTAKMAIASGASGVGVGSAINQLNDEIAMIAAVRSIVESLTIVNNSFVKV